MRGITLLELLVSVVIVSIMMVGILSVNNAIMRINYAGTDQAALALRTQAIVDMISTDARNAIGSRNNVGICINNAENNSNYFCFRNLHTSPSRTAPDTYEWSCYNRFRVFFIGRAFLKKTTVPLSTFSAGSDPLNCPCSVPPFPFFPIFETTSAGAVGTIATDVFSAASYPSFSLTNGFTMPVINRKKPQSPKSVTNPEARAYISVRPLEHSR